MDNELATHPLEVSEARVVLLIVMIIFMFIIIFARGTDMFSQSVVHFTSQDAVQVHLEPLHIPFSLEILGEGFNGDCSGTSAAQNAVHCQLKSEQPCQVRMFWRVPFSQLSLLLNRITAADVVNYNCQTSSYDPGEHAIDAVRDGLEPTEEPARRINCYPLVAVVETISPPDSPNSVVALLVVIHIRSPAAPMATAALHRYVRQADGRVTLMQPLYASGVESTDSGGGGGGVSAGPLGMCCVCHEAPAAVVLLPCRHGCVCRACFGRTATCPLCRGHVAQFFTVPAVSEATVTGPAQSVGTERNGHPSDARDARS